MGGGAFLIVRRRAWDEVGGFDERQWMYAEDLDLGWRLQQAGWTTRYEPRAHVDHESAASTTQLFGSDLDPHWQRSTYGFLARRRGRYTGAIALINALGAYLRWAQVATRPLRGGGRPGAAPRTRTMGAGSPAALRGQAALERLR